MSNLIALDWDATELRAVVARSSGNTISVVDAVAKPLASESAEDVAAAIKQILIDQSLTANKTRAYVTLGRGKTELRQLNLPPVPDDELPEMVRLQAMQSFVGISENAAVDYLPIPGADNTTSVLAAVAAPAIIKSVQSVVQSTGLDLVSIALRPVAAAALYQINANKTQSVDDSSIIGDVVLLDLLSDDAEIVVLRGRRVLFVRSVKLPPESAERPSQIAGELRRSLMACGINSSSTSQKIVIWGRAKTHEAERIKIAELLGCRVITLDPMTLVDLDKRAQSGAVQTNTQAAMHRLSV